MDTGFGLEETHLYVGIEILQQDGSGDFTVAPGQYDNIHEELGGDSEDTFILDLGIDAPDVYVVAHAVVSRF
jgi:hypothetical protein